MKYLSLIAMVLLLSCSKKTHISKYEIPKIQYDSLGNIYGDYTKGGDTIKVSSGIIYITNNGMVPIIDTSKYLDTIPALLLASDTAQRLYVSELMYIDTTKIMKDGKYLPFKIKYDTTRYEPFHDVIWIKGYVVVPIFQSMYYFNELDNYVQYLDSNKQPLRKSLIIWQTKIIK